ncbi:YwmB family TATA-box binding protein [Oceanobacillus timonensis]|uniref:YwmB family TATA-box binding protein n=1 Tax=Oceanobacillus timonensis TaxID=1926285 RepID=UPI0009BB0B1E|nr:YwmB family TATA-box binding protein [Oceanobacillus timonensis]
MFYRFFSRSHFPVTQKSTPHHVLSEPAQRNRQIFFVLLILCFIINQAFSQPYQKDEMQDLGTFAEEHDLPIHFWDVTMKEQMETAQAEQLIQDLKAQYPVQEEENENGMKYAFKSSHKEAPFDVLYNVILPLDKSNPAEVIIVLHGEDWDKQISQKYEKEKQAIQEKYLTKGSQVYTCLSVQGSDIINHDEFLNIAKTYFNIKHISTNNDNLKNSRIEKSTYGYTKTWEQFYFMENDPKNVQVTTVADRHGEKSFMIGTPILIHEY